MESRSQLDPPPQSRSQLDPPPPLPDLHLHRLNEHIDSELLLLVRDRLAQLVRVLRHVSQARASAGDDALDDAALDTGVRS